MNERKNIYCKFIVEVKVIGIKGSRAMEVQSEIYDETDFNSVNMASGSK